MSKVKSDLNFESLKKYLNDSLSPYLNAKTIQIILIRQVLDFTILRTEDSRELNTVELPKSFEDTSREVFGLFLASKQKAVETRRFMELLRTIKDYKCYLPMNLCMNCPRCVLFGAVKPSGGDFNIKHRIEYSSAFSIQPFADIHEIMTFNAINEGNQKTGQALNITHNLKPLTLFPSIITLKSVTPREFVMVLKTILGAHSYGAESRVKGDTRNEIIGIVGGFEEVITPLELNMELRELLNGDQPVSLTTLSEKTTTILEKYKKLAAAPSDVVILQNDVLSKILTKVRDISVDADFIAAMDNDVKTYTELAKKAA
ncbi:MAG: type I-D CRISPR-associated protein Cas7/Csc2 [Candidatus Helarchaeota archaeon]